MSDEKQKRDARSDMSRADQAKELISNPLYQEAITAMKAAMFVEFQDSKFDDEVTRQELWQRMQLMKLFEGKFKDIINKGSKAEDTIKMIEAKPENELR